MKSPLNFHANQPDDSSTRCKARLADGTRVTFSVSVTEHGELGRLDTISISPSNGYFVSSTLINGDIRIQQGN